MLLTKSVLLIIYLTIILWFAPLSACLAQIHLLYKSDSLDSMHYQMALQFAGVINTASKNNLIIEVEPSEDLVENVRDAAAYAEAYLFISPPELIDLAVAGEDPFEPSEHYADIRALFPLPAIDSQPMAVYVLMPMEDAVAYTLTKIFWDQKEAMAETQPHWHEVSTDTLSTLATVLHSGASKYYKEQGIGIPRKLQ